MFLDVHQTYSVKNELDQRDYTEAGFISWVQIIYEGLR